MSRPAVLFLAGLSVAASSAGQVSDPDQERSAWRYRRQVSVAAAGEPTPSFAALIVPPEVAASAQAELQDLRLIAADLSEVPFVIDRAEEREVEVKWSGRLVDTHVEKRVRTVWVVDLGIAKPFDRIELRVPQQDFAKRLSIEASTDNAEWRTIRKDVGIFDRPRNGRVHHTETVLDQPITARYLRVTADDRRSKPVELVDVTVSASRRSSVETTRRSVTLEPMDSRPEASRYRLVLPPTLPFEVLELAADDPAFLRRVRLLEVRSGDGRQQETVLGEGKIFRLRIEDEDLSVESLVIPARRGNGGERVLEIRNEDSPPLKNLRGTVSATATRLLFPVQTGALRLYYGNDATRAPVYDLDALKERIPLAPGYAPTVLETEEINPLYRKAPPLPFVALRGASVDVARWQAVRSLSISGGEDLYTLRLAAEDLGLLRRDLADLRIVDRQGCQLPYVLEAGTTEGRVKLDVTHQTSGKGGSGVNRYRLTVATRFSERAIPLPMSGVELRFREGFFNRPARLLAPPPPGAREGARPLFSGTLVQTSRRVASDRPPALVLPLDGEPRGELILEIEDGENAPLQLDGAAGVVLVPRIAFKAEPGVYRLLLGNPAAAAPRYDISSLRREILAYSAMPVAVEPIAANPAFRRKVGDYFAGAPPTIILWVTLVAAVVTLLALTARILRQPAA